MTKFYRPGKHSFEYTDLASIAAKRALEDAGIQYEKEIEAVYIGYVFGDSCTGQHALYKVGLSGVPVVNVNNNCATGSTALYLAHNTIKGGQADCVMALGFDRMFTGSLKSFFDDRENPLLDFMVQNEQMRGAVKGPFAPTLFANAGQEHMEKYGTTEEHFAKVAWKNHKHSVNNPYSQFRDEYTLEQIMNSPKVCKPLTKLQCCPTSDGAACAIVCSEKYMIAHGLQNQAVEIKSIDMTTDFGSTFNSRSSMNLIGADMARRCAEKVYKKAGISFDQISNQVQVCELHDCFSANELCTYESLGLCPTGKAGEAIDRGDFTYGGKVVVNPSGGLISKGHPLGATGLAQCAELCWQLKDCADKRQVKGAKMALQHNLGLGGACVIVLYEKYNSTPCKRQTSDPAVLDDYEKSAKM